MIQVFTAIIDLTTTAQYTKFAALLLGLSLIYTESKAQSPNDVMAQLLLEVKQERSTKQTEKTLATYAYDSLLNGLDTDNKRMAFWVNAYNAYYQILANRDGLSNPAIFMKKNILIAGKRFHLDDIEHGILRRYRYKYSMGYFRPLFVKKHIKKLAVKQLDYRVHFAMNCGAVSCPPIRFYTPEGLEGELTLATRSFLTQETTIDSIENEALVSRIFFWFRRDFGGKGGMRQILTKHMDVPDLSTYKIRFKPYDWTSKLSYYAE